MKIICIGRNYIDHAKELNNPVPKEPVFFLKPDSAVLLRNQPFYYPEFSSDIHYEVELVLKINRLGKCIQEKFAHKYYNEIGLGIDFTARDLQKKCKENGLPWEISKAFDQSAVISEFVPLIGNIQDMNIKLEKNGEVVQNGNTSEMIFTVDQLIAYVSQFMTLKIGDLIFTGTPAGVGPVAINDNLKGYLESKQMFEVNIK